MFRKTIIALAIAFGLGFSTLGVGVISNIPKSHTDVYHIYGHRVANDPAIDRLGEAQWTRSECERRAQELLRGGRAIDAWCKLD